MTNLAADNTTTRDNTTLYAIPHEYRVVFHVIYYAISTVSICGNLLIIYAVLRYKKMRNVTNYFITNLAIVDIVISLFSTPLQV
jgi:hypothetical protein